MTTESGVFYTQGQQAAMSDDINAAINAQAAMQAAQTEGNEAQTQESMDALSSALEDYYTVSSVVVVGHSRSWDLPDGVGF
jgi:hypothetical protein